jgi:hypothetical protein
MALTPDCFSTRMTPFEVKILSLDGRLFSIPFGVNCSALVVLQRLLNMINGSDREMERFKNLDLGSLGLYFLDPFIASIASSASVSGSRIPISLQQVTSISDLQTSIRHGLSADAFTHIRANELMVDIFSQHEEKVRNLQTAVVAPTDADSNRIGRVRSSREDRKQDAGQSDRGTVSLKMIFDGESPIVLLKASHLIRAAFSQTPAAETSASPASQSAWRPSTSALSASMDKTSGGPWQAEPHRSTAQIPRQSLLPPSLESLYGSYVLRAVEFIRHDLEIGRCSENAETEMTRKVAAISAPKSCFDNVWKTGVATLTEKQFFTNQASG